MFITIISIPVDVVINSEIDHCFLIKPFFYVTIKETKKRFSISLGAFIEENKTKF